MNIFHHLSRWGIALTLLLGLSGPLAIAQDADNIAESRSQEQVLAEIAHDRKAIEKLKNRDAGDNPLLADAISSRLLHARMRLLENNLELLQLMVGQDAPPSEERQQISDLYNAQISDIEVTGAQIAKSILPPQEKLSPAETAAAYSRIFTRIERLNRVYQIYIATIEQAKALGIDTTAERVKLKSSLRDRAENGAVLLELAISDVAALRASIAAVPDDADSKARLGVAVSHVSNLAAGMTQILDIMKSLDMETAQYQNQLLLATGQITTDIFQFKVFTNLLVGWGETLWNQIIDNGPGLLFNLLLLVVIIFAFYKLSKLVQRVTETALENAQVELSLLLKRMVVSVARNTVLIIGILIGLAQFGISLGPLLAGMGLVGFIVGFALQDTLSNFAAGMMILMYRPFDVDDVIEAGGVSGMVSKMSLVNTTFLTFDNQTIIVPNSKIWGDVIKNVTAQTIRRVDLVFGIAYSDDIEKAEKVMADVVKAHPAVLDDPEPMIRLHELGDSSVNFIVRPWVNRDDYWDTYWDLMRAMKVAFDENDISIPFPQRDVHLYQS